MKYSILLILLISKPIIAMEYKLLEEVGLTSEDNTTIFQALALVDKKQVMLRAMKENGYIKATLTPCTPYAADEILHNIYASQIFMDLSNKCVLERSPKKTS